MVGTGNPRTVDVNRGYRLLNTRGEMVSLHEQLQETMELFVQWRSSAFIQTSQSPGFHKHPFCLWKISYTKGLCSCLSPRLLLQSGLFKHDLMQAKHSGNPRDMDEDPNRHHENLVLSVP